MYYEIFVERVDHRLHELHMTRARLSALAGISPSFLSDLMNHKANPSLRIMESVAQALEVPLPLVLMAAPDPVPLPAGLVHACVVVMEFERFVLAEWDERNRVTLGKEADGRQRASG